ncbi:MULTISPECIES: UDP-glucose 4-epimerase GalE [unclassified Phenylobacterium]|uniref:UDP-glucose 4-epimerase GalE n=1 Tax=unclassified Phenylobacterium TaxID=2640670 RepID=UPI001F17AE11|nr:MULTISPECIES: UDP-glucose 4-epimerase GalE [unclassified Phenylobacterium]
MLVVGGAGYIGSHTAKALAARGYRPIVFDNLSSGHRAAVRWGPLLHGDIRDERALREAMSTHEVTAVIHFASLIEVGRSMTRPDLFYDHNVGGTARLLDAMRACGVPRLVFSSSAAVYGAPGAGSVGSTLSEGASKDPASPYGDTKLACERMIAAYARAFGISAVALRYFNAAGADASAVIGEAHEPETHLIPLAIEAALGLGAPLTVFGTDFPTPDGTCLRDYIHVSDLSSAHLAAVEAVFEPGRFEALNVGTGVGRSVFEVIAAIERETGVPTPRSLGLRRPGDPASLVAAPERIASLLGWRAQQSDLETIVRDALRWRRSNRFGAADQSRAAA